MPVHNADIAETLSQMADLLEIEGGNPFRVRAYRNAARTIGDMPKSVAAMVAEGADLSELPGIGVSIAHKIQEMVKTGHLAQLDEIKKRLPGQLSQLEEIPGLGPRRIKALYMKLGIESLEDLQEAVNAQQIRKIPGFSVKIEDHLRHELARRAQTQRRAKLFTAEQIATPLLDYLKSINGVEEAVVAGSYRRRKETVGDLDILVTCRNGARVMEAFVAYEDIGEILAQGDTRSTVRLRSGLQVDIRIVPQESYGAALHYFTGSKAHNVAVRTMAIRKGLKLNEYGVYRNNQRIAGRTEEEVYRQVDLPYIEPELREDEGEIEAALADRLPNLVTLDDIRGDLHTHTKASDGRYSIEEMALAARELGYDYIAITDHTKHTVVAHGLDEKRTVEHLKAIDKVNAKLAGITVLKSAEVDILEDGALDLPDWILREMDVVLCSIHSQFKLPQEKQTQRIIRAMDNPYFNILGHPVGRLINKREPYAVDMVRVMEAALERGCFLEANANPDRLDLTDHHCRMAKEMGLKVVLSTDAHKILDLTAMRFGIDQARRGWLEPEDILNTRSWAEMKALLQRS